VKYSLIQNTKKEEVIIQYIGMVEGKHVLFSPGDVLYLESVDKATFAYTNVAVMKIAYSLNDLELRFSEQGFFRCSKSMIVNIYQMDSLKSESGNRVLATLTNGEQVMISRHYAKELRAILKGGR
jgi:DNA-binding LytR/AlgR family response regulator